MFFSRRQEEEERESLPSLTRSYLVVEGEDVTCRKTLITSVEAVLHLLNGIVGTGILLMGRALNSTGLIAGAILLIFITFMNLYCQHSLIYASDLLAQKEKIMVKVTYSEAVQYTLLDSNSHWLKQRSGEFALVTSLLIFCTMLKICLKFFKFGAEQFLEVKFFSDYITDYRVVLAIMLPIIWVLCFIRSLRQMTYLVVVVVLCKIGILFTFVYLSMENYTPSTEIKFIDNPLNWMRYFQIVFFAFEATAFLLPIQREMKVPKHMTTKLGVLNTSSIIVFIVYLLFGTVVYITLREDSKNIFEHLAHSKWNNGIQIVLAFSVMLSVPFFIYLTNEIFFPKFDKYFGPYKNIQCANIVFKTFLLLIMYGLSNLPAISAVVDLIGTGTYSVLGLFMPSLLDLVLRKGNTRRVTIDVVIIVISLISFFTGIFLSFKDLMENFDDV